jgi:hypothetical protein
MPPPESPPGEPTEPIAVIEDSLPPEPVSYQESGVEEFGGEAAALWNPRVSGGPMRRHSTGIQCPGAAKFDSGVWSCGNPWKNEPPGLSWNSGMRSTYMENRNVAVWHLGGPKVGISCAKSQWGGPNSILQILELECEWKYKRSTSERNYIAARGDWHVFYIDPYDDKGYYPMLLQMFDWGCKRALGTYDGAFYLGPPNATCQRS